LSRQIRKANVSEPLLGEDEILNQLKTFLTSLHSKLADRKSVEYSSSIADQVMKNVFGFVLERRDSRLPGLSGRGVFVKDGIVPARCVVALYPGCVCLHSTVCTVRDVAVCSVLYCVCTCMCVCTSVHVIVGAINTAIHLCMACCITMKL